MCGVGQRGWRPCGRGFNRSVGCVLIVVEPTGGCCSAPHAKRCDAPPEPPLSTRGKVEGPPHMTGHRRCTMPLAGTNMPASYPARRRNVSSPKVRDGPTNQKLKHRSYPGNSATADGSRSRIVHPTQEEETAATSSTADPHRLNAPRHTHHSVRELEPPPRHDRLVHGVRGAALAAVVAVEVLRHEHTGAAVGHVALTAQLLDLARVVNLHTTRDGARDKRDQLSDGAEDRVHTQPRDPTPKARTSSHNTTCMLARRKHACTARINAPCRTSAPQA